ncbi:MAG: glycosyltransferase family 4 protein [Nanoarchaeota archaeon]|nr:glycosyltransferase family 4 protein [Nanoarchaeota archaeon]
MKRLKVLFLTSSYPTKKNISGPFIRNIAKGLVRKGIDVTVMIFSSSGKLNKRKDEGITVIEYPYSLFLKPALHLYNGLIPTIKKSFLAKVEFPLYLFFTSHYLKKISKGFDIIHAQWYFPSGLIAARCKSSIKKPLVTTAWGAEFHLPNSFIVRKLLEYVNKKSDIRVSVSNYLKLRASEYWLDTNGMLIVPNAVDIKQFSLKRKKSKKIVIAAIRRLVPEKRIQDLINAVAKLPINLINKMNLWIIGDGPERDRLVRLTEERGLKNITSFFGMVSHKEIPSLLSQIDICVNPSVQEGMATANIEAMASGSCVIATRAVGNDEVIIDGENGFLYEPEDVNQLSMILEKCIRNYPKRVCINARKQIKENFSIEKVADDYILIYKDLINKRGGK